MRKFASAAAVSFMIGIVNSLSGLPAAAQDLTTDWTGTYAGGHVGWISGSAGLDTTLSDALDAGVTSSATAFHMSDLVGGVHAGYNIVQNGPYVFGIEGDFDWTRTREGTALTFTLIDVFDGGTDTFTSLDSFIARLDWLSSLRARAGVADNNLMLYLTGGIAFANANLTITNGASDVLCSPACVTTAGLFTRSDSKTLVGYVIGSGAEMKFTDNISGRVEYLYYNFGSNTFTLSDGEENVSQKLDIHENVVRVGLSYYFK